MVSALLKIDLQVALVPGLEVLFELRVRTGPLETDIMIEVAGIDDMKSDRADRQPVRDVNFKL